MSDAPHLFADIDGVLNHRALYAANFARKGNTIPADWIDRACVARLDRICDETGAVIVISSSWRTYESIRGQPVGGLVGTVAVLRECGLRAPIVGATPDHTTPEQRERQERAARWPEIREWLDANPNVTRYAVIDDCEIPGVPEERFVHTSIDVGLTDDDVIRAVVLLRANT